MSEETPMLMYLNAHMAVDQMRTKNETEGKIGAKVHRYSSVLVMPPDMASTVNVMANFFFKNLPNFIKSAIAMASLSAKQIIFLVQKISLLTNAYIRR